MKRIIAILLCILAVISLASCGGGGDVEDTGVKDTTVADTTAQDPADDTEDAADNKVLVERDETFAAVGDVLNAPEVRVKTEMLDDFYAYVNGDGESSVPNGMSSASHLEVVLSVSGFNSEKTVFWFSQSSRMDMPQGISMNTASVLVIILDNANKTTKIYRSDNMGMDGIPTDVEGDDQMKNIIDFYTQNGEFKDMSAGYSYESARYFMISNLATYTGLCFEEGNFEAMEKVELVKRADEGDLLVYESETNGMTMKFRFDKDTGLMSSYDLTGENSKNEFSLKEYSFEKCLYTEEDVAKIIEK